MAIQVLVVSGVSIQDANGLLGFVKRLSRTSFRVSSGAVRSSWPRAVGVLECWAGIVLRPGVQQVARFCGGSVFAVARAVPPVWALAEWSRAPLPITVLRWCLPACGLGRTVGLLMASSGEGSGLSVFRGRPVFGPVAGAGQASNLHYLIALRRSFCRALGRVEMMGMPWAHRLDFRRLPGEGWYRPGPVALYPSKTLYEWKYLVRRRGRSWDHYGSVRTYSATRSGRTALFF